MMCCTGFIISLLLSLLVLLGGLFLLAYSKKESLGKFTKIVSYLTILFSSIVFVGGLICALMFSNCKSGKCGRGSMKCHKEVKVEYHKDCSNGDYCHKNAAKNCCKGDMENCSESECEKPCCKNE